MHMKENNNNSGRTIFSNGSPVLEISSKWGESSDNNFLTHSKEESSDGSNTLDDIIDAFQDKE